MAAADLAALPFREIWAVDFEFSAPPGELPDPACLVAWELHSGKKIRLWRDEFGPSPPYPTDAGSLFVAYYASSELGCHRVLGWPMPERILDLFVEFRNQTNGCGNLAGNSLLGALAHYGLDHIGVVEKTEMRDKFIAGKFDVWTDRERREGLDYCETDVRALAELLPAMMARKSNAAPFSLPHALLRGRYMAAVSAMEHVGIPIDVELFNLLRDNWSDIQDQLIAEIDKDYGVYDGRTFKADRFEDFLNREGIPWERLKSGRLKLDDDTFRQAAKTCPIVSPLRELRSSMSSMRLAGLAVGESGRNRTLLSPFSSITGRNQPSNSRYAFGPSTWLRGLIKPPPGWGVVYIDWSAAEIGIAAALSKDPMMLRDYLEGDVYLDLGIAAGVVPTVPQRRRTGRNVTCLNLAVWALCTPWGRRRWRRGLRAMSNSRA